MLEALLLDALLAIAILLLIPLGVVRGGLREICSSAGLLLGILLAQQWAVRWGNWFGDLLNVSDKGSRFAVAVGIVIVTTAVIGYGGSSAFSYRPGPGGKMFGAAIAMINGVVTAGFIVNSVATYINDGEFPDIVDDTFLTKALASGFDRVLLISAIVVMLLCTMGMIVRERDAEDQQWATQPASRAGSQKGSIRQVMPTKPYNTPEPEKIEPPRPPEDPQGPDYVPVKVREIRHWEEEPPPREGSGWQRTWPGSSAGDRVRLPWESAEEPPRKPERFRKVPPANVPITDPTEALKQWVSEDDSTDPKPGGRYS